MVAVGNRTAGAVYGPGQVRLSTTFLNERDIFSFTAVVGWVVQGDTLYRSGYGLDNVGQLTDPPFLMRIGGGWTNYKFVEEAEYDEVEHAPPIRTYEYGLRNDGLLMRWLNTNDVWRRSLGGVGFEAVKTMALISKTRTHDTFLATTRGGGLYTIRINVVPSFEVKKVRASTWQVFETLLAAKCGLSGTLLLGIDKDTQSGYLYAVGHANGAATVIRSLGKVQGTFGDPVYFRWRLAFDPLNGG
ncbi:hypothetical protein AB0H36_25115 [Kribbella sp. NPDC050820]